MSTASAFLLMAAVSLLPAAAHAQGEAGARVRINGVPLGSGVPTATGMPQPEAAHHVANGDFHVPNYLPGHPTAATLWPRVVWLPCERDEWRAELVCGGYDVSPSRGEYVYLRPLEKPKSLPPPPPPPPPLPPVRKKPLG